MDSHRLAVKVQDRGTLAIEERDEKASFDGEKPYPVDSADPKGKVLAVSDACDHLSYVTDDGSLNLAADKQASKFMAIHFDFNSLRPKSQLDSICPSLFLANDDTFYQLDATTAVPEIKAFPLGKRISEFAVNQPSKLAAVSLDEYGAIRFFGAAANKYLTIVVNFIGSGQNLAFLPEGELLAVSREDGTIDFYGVR